VHERRARLLRLQHVDDRGQFVVLQRNLSGNVFRLGACVCNAHGDQLTNLADLFGHEGRLFRNLKTRQRRNRPKRQHAGKVAGDKNGGAQLFGNEHGFQPRVGHRAAQKGDITHSRESHVADVLAFAVEKAAVLLSPDTSADATAGQDRPPCLAIPDSEFGAILWY
jgi:hypothetical protein